MKIAGYIITPLGVLAFIGTLLGGHSPIGPLFWIVVGITLLILGYRKEKLPISRENRNKKDNISDAEPAQLLQEIIKQTSPENFMDPYNAERVKNATVLHHKAKDIDADQPLAVLDLMENTIKELDCNYSSELVYKYLLEIFNPTNNRGEFDWRNTICQKLYNAKNDIAEMTLIVRREIEKKETQEKIELEQLRQEKLRQQQLKEEERKKETIRILKAIGKVIAIIALFLIIYIPIDYLRINKEKPNVWTMDNAQAVTICAYGDWIQYKIDIPECINECHHTVKCEFKMEDAGSSCFYSNPYGNKISFVFNPRFYYSIDFNYEFKRDGFSTNYKIKSDTLVWFTYDKYSLSHGRLFGNCICTLIPSPISHSPFPNYDNENIIIRCTGYGLTKEVFDSIVQSLQVKYDTLSNGIYNVRHEIKRHGSITKDTWENKKYYIQYIYNKNEYLSYMTGTDISLTIPSCYKQILSYHRYHNKYESLFLTDNMEAGISIISHPKDSITNFEYPIDSIIETSSVKCKIAGCDAIKTEASGYYDNKEYKYISYQLIKDNGYSTYQEPIFKEETYYDKEYQYVNGVYTNQPRKQTRTIIKGYKPERKRIKNEDLYVSILLGATPEWYEENKAVIDTIIESIQIKDVQ